MKAKYFVIAALIGAASFTSCSSEDVATEIQTTASTCPDVINVEYVDPVEETTRAFMGTDNKPVFQNYNRYSGDYLQVYSLNEENHLIERKYYCTNPLTGEFSVDDSEFWFDNFEYVESTSGPAVDHYVVFSHFYGFICEFDEKLFGCLPNGYYSSIPNDLPVLFAGTTDNLNNGVVLKSLNSLLKFQVPENSNITNVCIENFGAQVMYYDLNLNNISTVDLDSDIDEPINVSLGNMYYYPGQLPTDVMSLEPGVYYLPILPQEDLKKASRPFSLQLKYTTDRVPYDTNIEDINFHTKTKVGSVKIEAGKVYDLGTLDFN